MSITVTAVKARQNLGELLNLGSIKREEIILERAGGEIARPTSIDAGAVAVGEPVAEAHAAKKKEVEREPVDFSSIFGTWDDEEYRKGTEAVATLRTIDPEMWK